MARDVDGSRLQDLALQEPNETTQGEALGRPGVENAGALTGRHTVRQSSMTRKDLAPGGLGAVSCPILPLSGRRRIGRCSVGQALSFYTTFSALALLLAACGKPEPAHSTSSPTLPTAQVRVQPAQIATQPTMEVIVGTVRAKTRATLEAKVSGRIEKMPVVLGQRVKAGELVARLDAAEIKARLEQAQASLEQAERDWKRISSLFQSQAVTRAESDNAEARRRGAAASVAEAEAMMRYVDVVAPFDGVISRKWADLGDLANPGKPLVDLEDPSALQVDADVPESIAAPVQIGARLAVRLDGASNPLEGAVAEIAPSVDPASRTVRIRLDLPAAPGLIPGRFARVLIPTGENATVAVPASALVQRGQMEIVFVITNQQAHLHLVKSGKRDGAHVEILSGLDAGETVAVEGAAQLADGQPVQVK